MTLLISSFTVQSKGLTDIIDITPEVENAVANCGLKAGFALVFVPGSTAGITSIEYESGVVSDLKEAIERMAPADIRYKHDARWGDGNGFSHVRAALLGASFTVPFEAGRLTLGTWQQVVLIDFDNRPRQREVITQVHGE